MASKASRNNMLYKHFVFWIEDFAKVVFTKVLSSFLSTHKRHHRNLLNVMQLYSCCFVFVKVSLESSINEWFYKVPGDGSPRVSKACFPNGFLDILPSPCPGSPPAEQPPGVLAEEGGGIFNKLERIPGQRPGTEGGVK